MLRIYIRYGALIALALIAYFLLMKLFRLHEYPVLSIFNAVIYSGGILTAMQVYKKNAATFSYADGWQIGFMSGSIATLIFTAFMALYMLQLDTTFANAMLESWGITYTNGVLVMLVSIVLMGMSTAVVLALTFMQLLKVSWQPSKLYQQIEEE